MCKSSRLFFLLLIVEVILLISQAGAADLSGDSGRFGVTRRFGVRP